MQTFEVIFETTIYKSVTIWAEDKEAAADKALETKYPSEVVLPNGFEIDQEHWFVAGIEGLEDD